YYEPVHAPILTVDTTLPTAPRHDNDATMRRRSNSVVHARSYVAHTDERAREEAGRAVETLFNDSLRQSFEMLMPPGYTSIGSMKNFINMRWGLLGGGKATAAGLIESGTALIGTPRTVLAGIEKMRE